MAALTDVFSHKYFFFGAVVSFTVSSIVCALASSVSDMLTRRIIQGIGSISIVRVNLILLCKHVPTRY